MTKHYPLCSQHRQPARITVCLKFVVITENEDIKEAAVSVLRHRVMVAPEREMEGLTADEIIKQILESIEIPR